MTKTLLGKKLLAPRESRVLTKEVYIRYMTTYILAIRGGETKFADDFVTEYSFVHSGILTFVN